MIALIPARAGSRRIPQKNLRLLCGHPLMAYTIAVAKQAGIFERVVVSTEDPETARVSRRYGAEVFDRNPHYAADESPDYQWVTETIAAIPASSYALLRCTSPFRTVQRIKDAALKFSTTPCDSLRAVELVEQHPGKMWHLLSSTRMVPLYPSWEGWSQPTQTLPPIYVQNASLEMFHRSTVLRLGSISGFDVCPFVSPPPEGFDLNTMKDWAYAERMAASGDWTLPAIEEN